MSLSKSVESYFEACNSGDRELFFSLFEENAGHYLPKGMFGPLLDVKSLFDQWQNDAKENESFWVLEKVFEDTASRSVVAEWTAVKPKQDIYFRGVDVFEFSDDDKISEVRVYYATARDTEVGHNELGGYDYVEAGWYTEKT